MTTNAPINKYYLIPALLLLTYLAIKAGSLGLANLQIIKAENIFAQWAVKGQVSTVEQWRKAYAAVERSLSLHPGNPHNFTLQARLFEWRGLSESSDDSQSDFHRALELHQRAAELRPLWPYTWAEMAALKIRLNEIDEQLTVYIERAQATGPYTDKVHEVVVAYGLVLMAADPFSKIAGFKEQTLRGLQNPHSTKRVRELIEQNGRDALVCRWITQANEDQKDAGMCNKFK